MQQGQAEVPLRPGAISRLGPHGTPGICLAETANVWIVMKNEESGIRNQEPRTVQFLPLHGLQLCHVANARRKSLMVGEITPSRL